MDLYSHIRWVNGWYNGRRNGRHNIDYISWIYIYMDIDIQFLILSRQWSMHIYIITSIYTHWGYPLLLSNMVGREFPEAVIWIWQSSSQMATCPWGGHQSYPVDRKTWIPWSCCHGQLVCHDCNSRIFSICFFLRDGHRCNLACDRYVRVWSFSDVLIVCSCLSLLHSLVTFCLTVFIFGPSLFFGISYIPNLLLVLSIEVDLHVLIAVYLLFIGSMVILIISTRQSSMNFYVVCQRFYSCLFLWKNHVFLNVNHQSPWLKN